MDRGHVLDRPGGFGTVVVATGHMTDLPDRAARRFPEDAVVDVEHAIEAALAERQLGPGDLLICGGARGGDLLAARVALRRRATVWLLLARPPDDFETSSVAGTGPAWVDEFRSLLGRVPWWVLEESESAGAHDSDDVYAATNAWMLSVARVQAQGCPFHVLAVWDGRPADGPGGAADVVERARAAGAEITIIDPTRIGSVERKESG